MKTKKSTLASEMEKAGVRSYSVKKMVAASKTPAQTAKIKKARKGLAKAKRAKLLYELSPEGIMGRASRRRNKKK